MAVAPKLARSRLQALGVTRGHDHIGAFALGELRGRQTDAGRAPNDHDFLTCKQHAVSSDLCFGQNIKSGRRHRSTQLL
jgi:hypothetical protein